MTDAYQCDGCGTYYDGTPAVRVETVARLPGVSTNEGFAGALQGVLGPDNTSQGISTADQWDYCSAACAFEDDPGERRKVTIENAFEQAPIDQWDGDRHE